MCRTEPGKGDHPLAPNAPNNCWFAGSTGHGQRMLQAPGSRPPWVVAFPETQRCADRGRREMGVTPPRAGLDQRKKDGPCIGQGSDAWALCADWGCYWGLGHWNSASGAAHSRAVHRCATHKLLLLPPPLLCFGAGTQPTCIASSHFVQLGSSPRLDRLDGMAPVCRCWVAAGFLLGWFHLFRLSVCAGAGAALASPRLDPDPDCRSSLRAVVVPAAPKKQQSQSY